MARRRAWTVALLVLLLLLPAQAAVAICTGVDCIPATRWADASRTFHSNLGLSVEALAQYSEGTVTRLLFALAAMVWELILGMLRLATGFDLIGNPQIGATIDSGYATVARAVGGVGAVLLAVVAILVVTVRVARGTARGVEVVRPLVILAIIFAIAARAAVPGSAGSPSWLMDRASELTGAIGEAIALPAATALAVETGGDRIHCDAYMAALDQHFATALAGSDADLLRYRGSTMRLMSRLWEQSYLTQWHAAQFGDVPVGEKAGCWVLEHRAGVPPSTQARVASAAGMPSAGSGWFSVDDEAMRARTLAAAGCRATSSGWEVAPEFRYMWSLVPERRATADWCAQAWSSGEPHLRDAQPFSFKTGDEIEGAWSGHLPADGVQGAAWDACQSMIEGPAGSPGWLASRIASGLFNRTPADRACEGLGLSDIGTPLSLDDAQWRAFARGETATWGVNGHQVADAKGAGAVALLTALLYALAFGGVAVGAVLAQVGLVAWWVLLPLLLLAGMWPGEGGKARLAMIIRAGIGMSLSKIIFTTLLGALAGLVAALNQVMDVLIDGVEVIAVAQMPVPGVATATLTPIIAASADHGGSTTGSLLRAFPPLAAFLLLRMAAKRLQVGNPMSPMGAMRMNMDAASGFKDMSSHRPGTVERSMRRAPGSIRRAAVTAAAYRLGGRGNRGDAAGGEGAADGQGRPGGTTTADGTTDGTGVSGAEVPEDQRPTGVGGMGERSTIRTISSDGTDPDGTDGTVDGELHISGDDGTTGTDGTDPDGKAGAAATTRPPGKVAATAHKVFSSRLTRAGLVGAGFAAGGPLGAAAVWGATRVAQRITDPAAHVAVATATREVADQAASNAALLAAEEPALNPDQAQYRAFDQAWARGRDAQAGPTAAGAGTAGRTGPTQDVPPDPGPGVGVPTPGVGRPPVAPHPADGEVAATAWAPSPDGGVVETTVTRPMPPRPPHPASPAPAADGPEPAQPAPAADGPAPKPKPAQPARPADPAPAQQPKPKPAPVSGDPAPADGGMVPPKPRPGRRDRPAGPTS